MPIEISTPFIPVPSLVKSGDELSLEGWDPENDDLIVNTGTGPVSLKSIRTHFFDIQEPFPFDESRIAEFWETANLVKENHVGSAQS